MGLASPNQVYKLPKQETEHAVIGGNISAENPGYDNHCNRMLYQRFPGRPNDFAKLGTIFMKNPGYYVCAAFCYVFVFPLIFIFIHGGLLILSHDVPCAYCKNGNTFWFPYGLGGSFFPSWFGSYAACSLGRPG